MFNYEQVRPRVEKNLRTCFKSCELDSGKSSSVFSSVSFFFTRLRPWVIDFCFVVCFFLKECFIGLLTQRAKDVAVASGRKTIRYDDIETVAREGGWRTRFLLDHLKEVAPLIQKTSAAIPGSAQEEEGKENVVSKAAPVRRITDFFSK